jgi:hypothetical protein
MIPCHRPTTARLFQACAALCLAGVFQSGAHNRRVGQRWIP